MHTSAPFVLILENEISNLSLGGERQEASKVDKRFPVLNQFRIDIYGTERPRLSEPSFNEGNAL